MKYIFYKLWKIKSMILYHSDNSIAPSSENVNGKNILSTDNATETGEQMNIDDFNYNKAIDCLANGNLERSKNTHLELLNHTPQIYIDKVGAKNLKIIIAWDVAYLAMMKDGDLPGNYHNLGIDVMKDIPRALEDPLFVIKQKSGRIIAVTEIIIKGNRATIASIELDTFKSITQGGKFRSDNYNLIVTIMDAKPNYLQNTVFSGEVVYNKNNEDLAHFILRLKSLKKALPNDDLARPSDNSITQYSENVNSENLISVEGVSEYVFIKAMENKINDIVSLEDGKLYVQASRNVITGKTTAERRKEISAFFAGLLKDKPYLDIPTIEGDVLTITKAETADKARDNYKTLQKKRIKLADRDFLVKIHAEAHIDEISKISTKEGNMKSDGKNHYFAKDGFTYRKAHFRDFDNKYYEITLSIGHRGTTATVYNVVPKEKASPSAKIIAVLGSKPLGETFSNNSITQSSENVNSKNSISFENITERKNQKPMNDKEQLKEDLRARVEKAVESYRENPQLIAEYLSFAANFNKYSHKNLRLIWAQDPHARFVASASAFNQGIPDKNGNPISDEKIFIKKGEHALYIWCPKERLFVTDPKSGELEIFSHLTKAQKAMAISEGWEQKKDLFYILVPVFDIAQTTAPPELYPRVFGFGGDVNQSSELQFEAIKSYAENVLRCDVEICDFGRAKSSLRGTFSPSENKIRISDMLSGDGKLSTLIHELGHAELHSTLFLESEANIKSTAQVELEADMFSLMIESRLGLEPTEARCAHLSEHYGKYLEEVKIKLPEGNTLDLTSDSEAFSFVIERYKKQAPIIEEYIKRQASINAQYEALGKDTAQSSKSVQEPPSSAEIRPTGRSV